MNIGLFTKLTSIAILLILSALGATTFHALDLRDDITHSGLKRFQSLLLAGELLQSSEDLTRMARTYVITGDPVYERYFFEILDIRNGKRPRPQGYSTTYWNLAGVGKNPVAVPGEAVPLQELMRRAGFSEQEFKLLRQSQVNSDTLVNLEKQAFAAMKGLYDDGHGNYTVRRAPDREFAIGLLHGKRYVAEKASIMAPIKQFMEVLDERTQTELTVTQAQLQRQILLAMALIAIALAGATAAIFYTRRNILRPLDHLGRQAMGIAQGNYATRCDIHLDNEIAELGVHFNSMAEAIERDLTERQQTEIALSRGQSMMSAILENVSAYIYLKDTNGRYLFANQQLLNLWGATADEVVGFGDEKFFDAKTVEQIRANDCSVLVEGKTLREEETNVVTATGESATYWSVKLPLRHPDGSIYALCGISTDISERKQAETLHARLGHILDISLNEIHVFDAETLRIVQVNQRAQRNLGYSLKELQALTALDIKPDLNRESFEAMIAPLRSGEQEGVSFITRHRRRDGSLYPVEAHCHLSRAESPLVFVAIIQDITERKRAEALMRVSEEHLRTIIDTNPECIKLVGADGRLLEMNAAGLAMFEADSLDQVIQTSMSDLLLPEYHEAFQSLTKSVLEGNKGMLVFEIQGLKGTRRWLETHAVPMILHTGESVLLGISRDITEKKKSEELIWQQANFDTLTGLPNRRMFHDRLEQEVKKSHRSGLPMALMLLDLDRFKEVNDTLGHAQGDVLLMEAARRIAECVRESDTVARLGGDEFTVILSEVEVTNSVERIAQNIIERLAAPFQLLQETVYVSVSVGITLYPDDSLNIEGLMKNADQAMYLAKNSGRNRFSYFTAALQEVAQTRLRLGSDLRSALVGQQFQVYYQPIVTLANGAIHKAEALLRWQHPTRGFINPAEFVHVAEETGMIIDIGDWVFREVASQAASLRASHYAKFQISINISPVQFRHQGTNFKAWLDYLQTLGLPGKNIVMEITEGLLLDADTSVTEQLLAFRDAGIRVSLDDFGTGYSSLSYLKKFDIDYLKIDQSFVRNLADDANDMALCEAIIVMAHKLGLKVIAEGVETEQQRDLLAAYGCDYAQGWFYSKAVPSEQFEALLQGQAK